MNSELESRSDRSTITIFENEKLPANCILCDRNTEAKVTIKDQAEGTNSAAVRGISKILLFLFFPFRALHLMAVDDDTAANDRSFVAIQVPICRACKSLGKIVPTYIDYNQFSMAIEVCNDFKTRYESAKSPSILDGKKRWKPRRASRDSEA